MPSMQELFRCTQNDGQVTQTLTSSFRQDEFGFGISKSNKFNVIMIVNAEMIDESKWKLLS